MQNQIEFESRVFGGLPIVAKAKIYEAEPDVGLLHDYVDDIRLFFKSGREFTSKLYAKVSPEEWDRLHIEAMEASIDEWCN